MLLSSHQISEIEEVCDSFSVLSRGQVVWEGTATELRAQAPAAGYRLLTSDDERALEIAAEHAGVRAAKGPDGLTVEVEHEPASTSSFSRSARQGSRSACSSLSSARSSRCSSR